MTVRVRFAPSPTGQVHIGNIRTAIFNWLFARHEGGKFLLRIEDTDRERSTPEAVQAVLDAMSWLGLDYDEEPLYQTTRQAAHIEAAEKLLKTGAAYKEEKGPMLRPDAPRDRDFAGQGGRGGECVVFRMPGTAMSFHDIVRGDLKKEAEDMRDFVIVRSDGTPVFHLANVVDDIHMGVTHIIRGDDHIENTYRHVALFQALGADPPKYAHLPMIVNSRGKPYSKRDGDAYIGDFRKNGFSADALFNYLTLLGWSPGDDREKLTREETIALFSLDRVKSSAAQMDIEKLTHLNGLYLAEMPLAEFARPVREAVGANDWGRNIEDKYFMKVCALMQSRTRLYSSAREWKYFFSDDLEYDEKAVRKHLEGRKETLAVLGGKLSGVDFIVPEIERAIRETEKETGIPEGKLNLPVRVAVTGLSHGAGIYETMALLGKDRVLKRLEKAR